ncbi:UNVERIFIED_CONTAM: hypothetical protein HDU68_003144 [Siphonaria sp. JEL0065]|nr:hypothetical protein HDU68_003144 [Siphonaria sp. JEL0065]
MQRQELLTRGPKLAPSTTKSHLEPLNLSQETLHSADSTDSIPSFPSSPVFLANGGGRIQTPSLIDKNKPQPLRNTHKLTNISTSLSSLRSDNSNNSASQSLSSLNRVGSGLTRPVTNTTPTKKRGHFLNAAESMDAIAHEIEVLKIAKDKMGQPHKLGRTDSDECSVTDVFGFKSERRSGICVDRDK